jgi:hypothetical protein
LNDKKDCVNVLCLKWGTRYPAYYVNILYHGVKKHLHRPFRFVCVTDNASELVAGIETVPFPANPGMSMSWPNVFMKLLVTADGFANLKGPTLFLDIDIAITGDIDCFFDYKPGKNCIIHNWVEWRKTIFRKAPAVGNSSAFRFEAGQSQYICDRFLAEKDRAVDHRCFRTEQAFLTYAMKEVYWWPTQWVRSFKRNAMWAFPFNLFLAPTLPQHCRILAFHGRPDPEEALVGFTGERVHQHALPAVWLTTYWNPK